MANIQGAMLSWYDLNKRDLPWRTSKNPYFIWISEVVLQQTRVEQGAPFYHRLVSAFPTIEALASAEEHEVLLVWKGLGYYSRARNLHKASRQIMDHYEGVFPTQYAELIKLPGIGGYTAAAISSICFNAPEAAVDGNIIRIVSRLLDIQDPVELTSTARLIREFVNEVLPKDRPGDFNQALMDLGSAVCTPKSPACPSCPLADFCVSRNNNTQHLRPVKKPKKKAINRYLIFRININQRKVLMVKQQKGSIWENLYLFPFVELPSEKDFLAALDSEKQALIKPSTHVLSHQRLNYAVVFDTTVPPKSIGQWLTIDDIHELPTPILVPRILTQIENQSAPLF
ncbi:MAG: A/G-specific adenine glycosylase [Flavobacteriales bacterium]